LKQGVAELVAYLQLSCEGFKLGDGASAVAGSDFCKVEK